MTSASAASAQQGTDTRNLHWRNNNKGSTLLQKLGWKEGQALGCKQRRAQNGQEEETVSGEGLKIVKRKDGLGLGASDLPTAASAESNSHDSFSALLANLNKEHSSSSNKKKRKKSSSSSSSDDEEDNDKNTKSKKKSKKKKKKETIFASNRITNGRVRQSKFASKSDEDMACIFGKEVSSSSTGRDQQQQQQAEEQKRLKKERKREKKRARKEDESSSSSKSDNDDDKERKQKRKEEKRKKKKEQC